jgi:hypothetical protein
MARHYRRRLHLCQCARGGAGDCALCAEARGRGARRVHRLRHALRLAGVCAVAAEVLAKREFRWRWGRDYADAGAELCGARAQGGGRVMITSSHNPAEWNGVKYKASYGGSGSPSIMAAIESYLGDPLPERAAAPAKIEEVDFNPAVHHGDCEVCRPGCDSRVGLQVSDRLHVWLRARRDCGNLHPRLADSVCGDSRRAESAVSGDQSGADPAAHSCDAVGGGGGEVRRRVHHRWRRGPHRRGG